MDADWATMTPCRDVPRDHVTLVQRDPCCEHGVHALRGHAGKSGSG